MRVLVLYSSQRFGGDEDAAVRSEAALLRDAGIDVMQHVVNDENASPFRVFGGSQWSSEKAIGDLCERFQPDIVHVHNLWMRLTPTVIAAACASGAAVVQTLNNYQLICVSGGLSRNGAYCDDCVGRAPWRGVARRCYRDSAVASAAVAGMLVRSRSSRVWERCVRAFIAPSHFARVRFVAGGLPAHRVHVKPSFTADPGPSDIPPSKSRTAVFIGRLDRHEGIDVLLAAWAMASKPEWRLVIAGDGPERDRLQELAAALRGACRSIQFVGELEPGALRALLSRSRCLVLPSTGTARGRVVGAFAAGRLAIVSRSGGQEELVEDGINGFQIASGDPVELAGAIDICFASGRMADRMGADARESWVEQYTPQINLKRLLAIYEMAMERERPERVTAEAAFG